MLLENPRNPLNLVGGSKFFTDPQHYRKTRHAFCVQTMGLLVLTILYAVLITTLGGYTENDYARIGVVFQASRSRFADSVQAGPVISG